MNRQNTNATKCRLLTSVTLGCVLAAAFAGVALAADGQAQTSGDQTRTQSDQSSTVKEVVVTGSRIPRAKTDTAAPVDVVNAQDLTDRGYINAGDALNDVTSNSPSFPVAPANSGPAGDGQTYPNLFNLGSGRTLTLVNGLRFVSSATPLTPSSSLGYGSGQGGAGNGVDTGLIPIGLLDHIDVVEGGGAAVYGSDAIAGVINYQLKKNFSGVEGDVQYGESGYGDHDQYHARITAGQNFNDNRGNIAVDFEWSKTDPLLAPQRNYFNSTGGIQGTEVIPNFTFYEFNNTGILTTQPSYEPTCSTPSGYCFVYSGGAPVQFSKSGTSLIPFNPGVINSQIPFASGGDGEKLEDFSALSPGIDRKTATIVGHYDLTDHLRISGSFEYANEVGVDPVASQGIQQADLAGPSGPYSAIPIYNNNPYLTSAEISQLTSAYPAFGAGSPLYLGKNFVNVIPNNTATYPTNVYDASVSLDGDFDSWNRHFTYNVSFSHGEVDSAQEEWTVYQQPFLNAVEAVKNSSGQIVCSINAVTVVDANCVPFNPFGFGKISAAAAAYIDAPVGFQYTNAEDDLVASFGGDLVNLPGGKSKFSVTYEHRNESDSYVPAAAYQEGTTGSAPTPPTGGRYDTNEYAGELLVPLLGNGFTLPWIKGLDFSAQGRLVDNSIAGQNTVWGLGLDLKLKGGVTLRASRSQNFRAPTLYQLNQPALTQLGGGITDPCDNRFINTGPDPAVQAANCLALFNKNPTYGTGPGEAAPGSPAAARLAAFEDTAVNFSTAEITSEGNPDLKNEVSESWTTGVVLQPRWVPGALMVTADYVWMDILNGLTAFTPSNFADACMDAVGSAVPACNYFTRDQYGNISTGAQTTYNAASVKYAGEIVNIDYRFPVAWIIRRPDSGSLELQLQTTHNETLSQVVDGVYSQAVGTINEPRWVVRGNIRYTYGPYRFTYQAYYLPPAAQFEGANASNTAFAEVKSNLVQSISASYDFAHRFQIRAGINNIANQEPSIPTFTYGDYIGRTFFVGLKAKY